MKGPRSKMFDRNILICNFGKEMYFFFYYLNCTLNVNIYGNVLSEIKNISGGSFVV